MTFFTELMELADMYWETNLINDLIKDRSQIIKKAITVSNVSFFYNKAIKYNAKVRITSSKLIVINVEIH